MKVDVQSISLRYPGAKADDFLLKDLSLTINEGEFVCLLGPSGCGKSSLLGLLAGFVHGNGGQVLVDGVKITHPDSSRTLVFQEYALFPWLNVIDNVAFGLEHKIKQVEERYLLASKYLKMVGLLEYARANISELSGGMKQRVALARALVVKPKVLLMDEPFGALDDQTRTLLQQELINIYEELNKTVVFVTHSVDEALLLADRVIVMGKETPSSSTGCIKADIQIKQERSKRNASDEINKARQEVQDALYGRIDI